MLELYMLVLISPVYFVQLLDEWPYLRLNLNIKAKAIKQIQDIVKTNQNNA